MRTEKWYHKRLNDYFYENYSKYEYHSEWFVNPSINQWKCYIPPLGMTIVFTCDENGNVTEEKESFRVTEDKTYEIVEAAMRGMDAIYEDYIMELVGEAGFNVLRKYKHLQACGSINGRNLYVLTNE